MAALPVLVRLRLAWPLAAMVGSWSARCTPYWARAFSILAHAIFKSRLWLSASASTCCSAGACTHVRAWAWLKDSALATAGSAAASALTVSGTGAAGVS